MSLTTFSTTATSRLLGSYVLPEGTLCPASYPTSTTVTTLLRVAVFFFFSFFFLSFPFLSPLYSRHTIVVPRLYFLLSGPHGPMDLGLGCVSFLSFSLHCILYTSCGAACWGYHCGVLEMFVYLGKNFCTILWAFGPLGALVVSRRSTYKGSPVRGTRV